MSHNVFAQLAGRKTFFLAPPTAWARLRVHPWTHPGSQKAQARLPAPLVRLLKTRKPQGVGTGFSRLFWTLDLHWSSRRKMTETSANTTWLP